VTRTAQADRCGLVRAPRASD